MAVSWSTPRDDDEPTTPTTHRKVVGMGVDAANPYNVAYAYGAMEPVPYAPPDKLQYDVIEPTAVYKPWLPSTDWANVEITVEYYD
jgi:hypothetical protein